MVEHRKPAPISEGKARRQKALADWFTEWAQRHGVDEVEDASVEAQDEYWRRARELMGLDPETGFRPGVSGRRRRRRS